MVYTLRDIYYRSIFISAFPIGYCQEQAGECCQFAGFYLEDGKIAAIPSFRVKIEKYNHKFSLIDQYSLSRRFARFADESFDFFSKT